MTDNPKFVTCGHFRFPVTDEQLVQIEAAKLMREAAAEQMSGLLAVATDERQIRLLTHMQARIRGLDPLYVLKIVVEEHQAPTTEPAPPTTAR